MKCFGDLIIQVETKNTKPKQNKKKEMKRKEK